MTKPSCLNCAYGKDKETDRGFYCGGTGSFAEKYCHVPYRYSCNSAICLYGDADFCYKPRQNPCETDGCKWMVEKRCTSTGVHNVSMTGQPCRGFKKQEEKQLPNQWYKGTKTGDLYYSRVPDELLTRLKSKEYSLGKTQCWDKTVLIKTDPPLIIEKSDTAERRPELCVHNEGLRCQIRLKTGHGHCVNTAYTDCPDYTPK